jgi:transcriptional regulator with GAF, ATPase, and Fis domain
VIEELEARGGFVVLCRPDSTEAEIACARNYESSNLSLDEHRPSRSVIREVLRRGGAVRLEDAAAGEGPASLESVRELGLRSLLAVPIGHPPLGVLYLDHAEPGRFSRATAEALTVVASWVAAHLRRARLLPAAEATGPRVFLDAGQATRALVGNDPRMREVLSVIARVADREATVLIRGESGTGKELVARALHYQSARREHPFVALNSAAIPEQLFESELFGHERGAFTGADRRYVGRLEQADGGTLFLDEIDEMPFGLQAKLLRFLESKVISPLGSTEARRLDVRVVAATSRDLASAADDGTFQKSLYFRLNVVPIDLPPLRERRGDIPPLVEHFLKRYGTLYGRRLALAPETLELLGRYDFPGNVRELENLVHRLAALCESDVAGPADLPREVGGPSGVPFQLGIDPALEAAGRAPDLETFRRHRQRILDRLAEEERCVAERAVEAAGGSVSRAARRLGVHRVTLHRMLKRGS